MNAMLGIGLLLMAFGVVVLVASWWPRPASPAEPDREPDPGSLFIPHDPEGDDR